MKVDSIAKARPLIGQRLFWEEHSNRYIIERSGILTDVYRRQLEFDDQQDYQPLKHFKNLRTEE